MAVLRFVRDLSTGGGDPAVCRRNSVDVAIDPLVMPRDRAAVTSLADEAREGTVSFSGRGLVGELESREGRRVTAWLAWQSAGGGRRPVGVVMLAQTVRGFSIPWLLVDPDVRRRGVACMLVATAIDHARGLGASLVTAETLDSWPESAAFWPAVGFVPERAAAEVD